MDKTLELLAFISWAQNQTQIGIFLFCWTHFSLFFINQTLSKSLWTTSQIHIFSKTTDSVLNWHFIQLKSPTELGCFTGKATDLPFSFIAFYRIGMGRRGSPQKINENASLCSQTFSKFIIFFLCAKLQKEDDAPSKCIQNNYSNFCWVFFRDSFSKAIIPNGSLSIEWLSKPPGPLCIALSFT